MSSKRKHACTNMGRALRSGPGRASGNFARARAATAGALVLGLYASVFPGVGWSQSVPVPALDRPAFQSQDLDPYFAVARGAGSETGWEWIVAQGRAALAAQWENYLDAQIAAHVNAVNTQDQFNSVNEYRDYLLREFQLQKQAARNDWELAAELSIQSQRDPFMENLAASIRTGANQDSRANLNTARDTLEEAPANLSPELARQRETWRDDFEESVRQGMAEYGDALSKVQLDHEAFLAELAQREAEFEQHRLQIQAYEETVRNNIASTVTDLSAYLASNGLFHQETCDPATNICTINPNQLNGAGLELKTFLDSIQDKLNTDAPLSEITQLMTEFVELQHSLAGQRRQYWTDRKEGDADWVGNGGHATEISPHGGASPYVNYSTGNDAWFWDPHNISARSGLRDWGAIYGNSALSSFMSYANSGGASQDPLKSYIRSAAGLIGQVTSISDVDLCGEGRGGHGATGQNRQLFGLCYYRSMYHTNCGNSCLYPMYEEVFTTSNVGCHQGHCYHTTTRAEQFFRLKVRFHWFDEKAFDNEQTWQGYVNDIDPVMDRWRLELLPAIQNWEAQTASFEANYAAWRAEAAQKSADADAQYEATRTALLTDRSRWLGEMDADYRAGVRQWRTIERESAALTASGAAATTPPAGPDRNGPGAAIQNQLQQFQNSLAGAAQFQNNLASTPLDYSALAKVNQAFGQTALGLQQFTLARTLDDEIRAQQQSILDSQVEMLSSLDSGVERLTGRIDPATGKEITEKLGGFVVETLPNGAVRATRQIYSGRATQSGGDGTGLGDYQADMTTQVVEFTPAPTIAAPKTGNLFEQWDTRQVLDDFSAARQDAAKDIAAYFKASQAQLMDAFSYSSLQEQRFVTNRSESMAGAAAAKKKREANSLGGFLKSVGMAMFTGGIGVEAAMQQEIQNRFSSQISEALGIPASFTRNLVGGMRIQDALDTYVATDLRNEMISEGAAALGWPETLVRGLADGKDMKTAWKDTTQELVMDEIEKRVDDPAMQALLKQTVQGLRAREDKKAALAEARTFHNEDYATLGATYVMRELDAQGVTEVGGKVFPVLNSMQSVYRMHREGVPVGGKMLAELAEGSFNTLGGGYGANIDLEVTDRGLSASASIGMPLGMGPTLLSADWQEGRGVTESHVIEGDEWKQFGSKSIVGGLKTTLMDGLSTAMQGPSTLIKMLQGDADLHAQLEQGLAARMEEEAYKSLAASSNLPVSLIKGVVDGADMKQVWKETTDELIIEGVVTEMDCGSKPRDEVQACNMMAANMQQKFRDWRKEQNLRDAQKMRSEDYATGGLTMVWRTAQYDEDTALALSVAEMAGGAAAAAFPGVGTAAYIAYTASKQAYGSYQTAEKDERGQAVLAGLLGGAVSGATRAYTEGAVDVGLSYSAEEGFGTSVTLGKSYGNLQAGVTLDFNQRKGYTGGSAGVDYKLSENAKLTANAEFSKERGFEGARVGLALNNDSRQQPPATGLSGEIGLRINRAGQYDGTYFSGATGGGAAGATLSGGFDRNGRFTGATLGGRVGNDTVAGRGSLRIGADGEWSQLQLGVQASLMKKAGDEVGQQFSYAPGAGLTLNRNGSFSVSLESAVKWEDSLRAGLSELTPTNTTTFSYDANGNFQSASTAARIDSEFRSEEKSREAHLRAQAAQRAQMDPETLADYEAIRDDLRRRYPEMQGDRFEALVQAELLDYAAETGMTPAEQADLEKLAALDERYNTESMGAQVELLQRLANEGTIRPDQIGQYLEDPKALHDLLKAKQLVGQLPDYVRTGDTREGLDILTGAFGDAWNFLAGSYSDRNGYIDSDTGQYVVNTCFVAGTPVRVAAGVSGAYRSGGHWYKPIEKIEIGETVLSWNESSGALENRVVTETFVHKTNLIFELRYADGSRVQTTWNHPFYVEGRGWVQVKDLRAGDISHTRDLIAARAERDDLIRAVFGAANSGALAQSNLAASAGLAARGGLVLAAIRKIRRDDLVYNLEVDGTHTYFVTERDVLVHNYNFEQTAPGLPAKVSAPVAFSGLYGLQQTLQPGTVIEILSTKPLMINGKPYLRVRAGVFYGYIPFDANGPTPYTITGQTNIGESNQPASEDGKPNYTQPSDGGGDAIDQLTKPQAPPTWMDEMLNCERNGRDEFGRCDKRNPSSGVTPEEVRNWGEDFLKFLDRLTSFNDNDGAAEEEILLAQGYAPGLDPEPHQPDEKAPEQPEEDKKCGFWCRVEQFGRPAPIPAPPAISPRADGEEALEGDTMLAYGSGGGGGAGGEGRASDNSESGQQELALDADKGMSEQEIRVRNATESHYDAGVFSTAIDYIAHFLEFGAPTSFESAMEDLKSGHVETRTDALSYLNTNYGSLAQHERALYDLHLHYSELGPRLTSDAVDERVIQLMDNSRDIAMAQGHGTAEITPFDRESVRADLIRNGQSGRYVDDADVFGGLSWLSVFTDAIAKVQFAANDTILDFSINESAHSGSRGDSAEFFRLRSQIIAHELFHVYQFNRDNESAERAGPSSDYETQTDLDVNNERALFDDPYGIGKSYTIESAADMYADTFYWKRWFRRDLLK